VAAQVGDKATLAKLNVDEAPRTAGQLGIRSIPTLVLFKNGEPQDGFVGVQDEATLTAAIERATQA
jgi:thioredoxin-like negative regulator of GroEL